MALDETLDEGQTGHRTLFHPTLHAWFNAWIKTPGTPGDPYVPADVVLSDDFDLGNANDVNAASRDDGDILVWNAGTSAYDHEPNGSAISLNSGLIAVKTWDTGSSSYVWPGGTAPDSSSYDFIRFRGPTDPIGATGGRNTTGDEWMNTAP